MNPRPPYVNLHRMALVLVNVCLAAGALAADAPPDALAPFKVLEGRFQQVISQAAPCTVAIRVGNSQGSGVIVSADGLVATAGHLIVKPKESVIFVLPDGTTRPGTTLGLDRAIDCGLMKITAPGPYPHLDLGHSADLKPGTWCVALGHPLGYHEGRPPVARIGRLLTCYDTVLRTDCSIVAGDSGGPLLDLDARVIGINSRIGMASNMNYHAPVDRLHDHWERLVAGEALNDDLPGRDAAEIKSPFRAVVAAAARCVVRVLAEGKPAALGTIVGPDGWILTKASELHGKLKVHLRDGRDFDARLVGVHSDHDLAMLKIEADGLPDVPWAEARPAVGGWLASAGLDADPLALAVASVPERRIPPPAGMLGVIIADAPAGIRIVQVLAGGPGEKAGLKTGDCIQRLNDQSIPNRQDWTAAIKRFRLGEAVHLAVRRGEQQLSLEVTLGQVETAGTKRRDVQNLGDTGISRRHDDFPCVLQHDGVVQPTDCGGPVVDLSGRVVGLNIARAGRTETYAIPTEILLHAMYDLMSGRLAPRAATVPTPPAAKQASESKVAPAGESKPASPPAPDKKAKAAENSPSPSAPPSAK